MPLEEETKCVNQTLGWLKTKGVRGRRGAAFSYAKLARLAFDGISELRQEGLSLITICEAFETDGSLPKGANPYSLGRALKREADRRGKRSGGAVRQQRLGNEQGDREPANVRNTGPDKKPEQPKPKPGDAAGEKERLKELTGTLVDTGMGIIRKFPNGSFEF